MTIAPVMAARAGNFVQSIGINTHLSDPTTSYGNLQTVGSQLSYLGVDHVRDLIPGAALGSYQVLAAEGIKFDLEYPSFALTSANLLTEMAVLDILGSAVSAVEGPNEPNLVGLSFDGVTGIAGTVALQKALYAAVHGDTILNNSTHTTSVLPFSLSAGANYAPYGNLSSYADYTNVHAYAQYGVPPYWALQTEINGVTDTPGRQPVITESGNYTLLNHDSGVSESVQAKWDVDVLLEAFQIGVATTYLYELQDAVADPTGTGSAEYYYGLFHNDGTPKLAAVAIHNLTTILQDRGPNASSFVPASLPYTVTGLPYYGFQNLTEKSDGTFDIAIWAEPPIWNSATDTDIVTPPSTISVTFAHSYATINVYDLLSGTTPIATYHNANTISLSLGSDPLIVEVMPIAVPPPQTLLLGPSGTTSVSGAVVVQAGTGSYTVDASGAATIIGAGGALTVALTGSGASVTGGAGTLTVTDSHGGNTITGEAGAFDINALTGDDAISTGTSASNSVKLGSGNDTVTALGRTTLTGGSGLAVVTLNSAGSSVTGGTGILEVADKAGGNTITGGSGAFGITTSLGSDSITTGTSNTNSVALGSGNDTVTVGAKGDSTVIGGSGNARVLLKGSGNLILGGTGTLTVTDAVGGNTFIGGTGPSSVDAAAGNDAVTTNNTSGTSSIILSTGADTVTTNGTTNIRVNKASLTVSGNGDLSINGGIGSITLTGGAGSEYVFTQPGTKNLLTLGSGKDSVLSHGTDTINAGAGADYVYASGQSVLLHGGSGSLSFTANATSNTYVGGSGSARIGGAGNLSITGGMGSITLTGGTGSEYVFTQAGTKNLLTLGSGKDSVISHGADTINAGAGADNIYAGGAALINGDGGPLSVSGHSGAITVNGGTGAVHATAGSGGGYVKGGSNGGNALIASAGNTTLVGAGNGDTLTDSSTSGSNTLIAGAGSETLTGGTGAADLFVLTQSSVTHDEVIQGFAAGTDHLHFAGFGATQPIASQAVVGGNLQLTLADNAHVTLIGITSLGSDDVV